VEKLKGGKVETLDDVSIFRYKKTQKNLRVILMTD
jgi:hypothetical protein